METTPDNKETTSGNAFYDWLSRLAERINLFSEFKEDDGTLIIIGKVIVRIIGFFILLLLSPFIFIGLMLAFATAF